MLQLRTPENATLQRVEAETFCFCQLVWHRVDETGEEDLVSLTIDKLCYEKSGGRRGGGVGRKKRHWKLREIPNREGAQRALRDDHLIARLMLQRKQHLHGTGLSVIKSEVYDLN